MAKLFAKKFYNSKHWITCRQSFRSKRVAIDGGMCQDCKGNLGYIVDHIVELTPLNIDDVNITLNHENLQYLCLECHNTKTFQKNSPVSDGMKFDENGRLVRK